MNRMLLHISLALIAVHLFAGRVCAQEPAEVKASTTLSTDSTLFAFEEPAGSFWMHPAVAVLDYGVPGHWTQFTAHGLWDAGMEYRVGDIDLESPMYGHYNLNWIPWIVLRKGDYAQYVTGTQFLFRPRETRQMRKAHSQVRYSFGDFDRTLTEVLLERSFLYRTQLQFAARFQSFPGRYGEEEQRGRGIWIRLTKNISANWTARMTALYMKNALNEIDRIDNQGIKFYQPLGRRRMEGNLWSAALEYHPDGRKDTLLVRTQMSRVKNHYHVESGWNADDDEQIRRMEIAYTNNYNSITTRSHFRFGTYTAENDSLFKQESHFLQTGVRIRYPYSAKISTQSFIEYLNDSKRGTAVSAEQKVRYRLREALDIRASYSIRHSLANWYLKTYMSSAYAHFEAFSAEKLKTSTASIGAAYRSGIGILVSGNIFQRTQTPTGTRRDVFDAQVISDEKQTYEYSGITISAEWRINRWLYSALHMTHYADPPDVWWMPFQRHGAFQIECTDIQRMFTKHRVNSSIGAHVLYFHQQHQLNPLGRLYRFQKGRRTDADYIMLNLFAEISIRSVTVWYQVNNILQEDVMIIAGYKYPRLIQRVGVRWNFRD